MKKLNFIDKLIFIVNSLAATALLLSYLLPYIPPKTFPIMGVLSLGVPVLILVNILFLAYWLVKFKRQFLLSLIVLLIGFKHVSGLYQFSGEQQENEEAVSLMSYNVRMFNAFDWIDKDDIPESIAAFVKEKDPDILCMQEFYSGISGISENYPYQYIKIKSKNSEFGSAIFSKYPIINRYSVDFPQRGNNNAIYADIVVNEDTLRIFNVHFQSLNIKPEIHELQKEDSRKLLGRMGGGFAMQQEQAELMMKEVNPTPYKTLVAGDFNNTTSSYIYDYVNSGDKIFEDAFLERGKGFGQTFKLNYYPLRIDFFLVEENMDILGYERFKVNYSDHYPITTKIKL